MPIRKTTVQEAPYSPAGSLLHYTSSALGRSDERTVWRENDPFHATLRLHTTRSGHSAKYVIWKPAGAGDDREFPMFVTDLVDLAQHAVIEHGVVSARWVVRRRGVNYGIALAPAVA